MHLKILPIFIAISVFAGKCGAEELIEDFNSTLNINYWTKFQIGSFDYISVECPDELGRLKVAKDRQLYEGQTKKGGIISRFFIDGNLSFIVDFDIVSMPFTESEGSFNEVCIALVSVETGETIYWVRTKNDNENILLGYSSALGLRFGVRKDSSMSGSAGIFRIGNLILLYLTHLLRVCGE